MKNIKNAITCHLINTESKIKIIINNEFANSFSLLINIINAADTDRVAVIVN